MADKNTPRISPQQTLRAKTLASRFPRSPLGAGRRKRPAGPAGSQPRPTAHRASPALQATATTAVEGPGASLRPPGNRRRGKTQGQSPGLPTTATW